MEQEVLVVGANGRIGRASVEAFLEAGWKVRAFVRNGSADRVRSGVTIFEGDAFDAQAVAASAEGVAARAIPMIASEATTSLIPRASTSASSSTRPSASSKSIPPPLPEGLRRWPTSSSSASTTPQN